MINITDPNKFDFDEVPIDPFWNTGEGQEFLMHKIHAYPAKFPAFLTTKALQYARQQGVEVNVISDIFCGCGTTAYEAKRNNIDFWGCDINPIATLIARTKSNIYEKQLLINYLNQIVSTYYSNNGGISNSPNERINYWFKEEQFNDLAKLLLAIQNCLPYSSKYYDFFTCAFSNILKPTSMWLTKSIKPQFDPEKKPADVISSFVKQCNFMVLANDQNVQTNSITQIETINFLQTIDVPRTDLVITSPPYVTSYEYADLHQLSTIWLNYADDYRELRAGTIGSLHHDYNFNKEFKRINTSGHKIVSRLIDKKNKKAKSVAKYFLDIQEVSKKTYSILKKEGIAVFVIGDTEYQGIKIENAKHLSESLISAGFQEINITKRKISKKNLTPFRDSSGKFTSDENGRKIYSEEFIIIGRR